jgi:hypothetical protein
MALVQFIIIIIIVKVKEKSTKIIEWDVNIRHGLFSHLKMIGNEIFMASNVTVLALKQVVSRIFLNKQLLSLLLNIVTDSKA